MFDYNDGFYWDVTFITLPIFGILFATSEEDGEVRPNPKGDINDFIIVFPPSLTSKLTPNAAVNKEIPAKAAINGTLSSRGDRNDWAM